MLKQGRAGCAQCHMNDKGQALECSRPNSRRTPDVYGAISVYASQFAQGHEDAGIRLESYGVQPERLLVA